jgi:HNH endonuclease
MTPAEAASPLALLSECFDPDPETASGLRWMMRLPKHFDGSPGRSAEHRCNNWNSKWAGKPAGAQNSYGHFVVELTVGQHKLQLLAHRIVYALVNGHWPPGEVDHKKGVEGGNGIGNLRDATRQQNAQNLKMVATNTSGLSWCFLG